eukprot:Partr_v1_DN28383_c1_g1_i1_m78386 putative ornithine carbamoyltransferase
MNHFLSLAQFPPAHLLTLLKRAAKFKECMRPPLSTSRLPSSNLEKLPASLHGKSLAMLFTKRSTRTRLAAETGFAALGGTPIFLGPLDIQFGINESLKDTARVISSMADVLFIRCGAHADIEEFARHSSVPVVNALTDRFHPTQILADLMTLFERFGPADYREWSVDSLSGLRACWLGDCNNVVNSMVVTLPRFGVHLSVATPVGYDFDRSLVQAGDGLVTFGHDPVVALGGSQVIVTDTWISMGQEAEKAQRLRDFHGFQITRALIDKSGAHRDWVFLHCLPRKSEEVDDEVFYDAGRSLVFQEAENRKYTIMAVLESVIAS